jgi:hypothetical protein
LSIDCTQESQSRSFQKKKLQKFNVTFLYEIEAIAKNYGLEHENVGKRNTSTLFFPTRNILTIENI